MSTHPTTTPADPLLHWERDLLSEVVDEMPTSTVGVIGAAAAGAIASTTVATAAAVAAQGGTAMTMTGATVEAAASSNVAAKIAAGSLAAALAVGGSAAVTGNLPDGAQEATADAAARIGITLPRPEADVRVNGSLDASAGEIITVGTAGRVGVTLEDGALRVTGTETRGAFTAHVVSETDGAILVEFRSATETVSVLLTNVEGAIASSITTQVHGSVEGRADAEGSVSTGADTGDDSSVKGEAEADARFRIRIGG